MASLAKQPNGSWTVQVKWPGGKRHSIRCGKLQKKDAEKIRVKIGMLQSTRMTGDPLEPALAAWLKWSREHNPQLHSRMVAAGLADERPTETLAAFCDAYLVMKATDVNGGTLDGLQRSRDAMVRFFGEDMVLQSITEGHADEFRIWLQAGNDHAKPGRPLKPLAENTVRRMLSRCKQFFKAACKKRLLANNPFADLPTAMIENKSRMAYIDHATAMAVLEACPDIQWRCIFSLCRWGGLRCPSEVLGVTWGDVDRAGKWLTVRSPKTAHQGKPERLVPLFPELEDVLAEAYTEAEVGSVHVITHYHCRQNLRTQFLRLLARAGIPPWEKPFQNLRSTRQTELEGMFPTHVVCSWMGNTPSVAAKHYYQVTAAHHETAVQRPDQKAVHGGAKSGAPLGGIEGNLGESTGTHSEQK